MKIRRKTVEETRLLTSGNAVPYAVDDGLTVRSAEPPDPLVEDLIPAGYVCALTSMPGVGKTWLALEVARAVTTGTSVMGQFAVHGGPQGVLLVGSDSSLADYGRQWRRLTEDAHAAWVAACDPDLPEEFQPADPHRLIKFLVQSRFMLDSDNEVRRLIATVLDERAFPVWRELDYVTEDGHDFYHEREGPALIVLDTLSRLTTANQNDNTEMERVMANARVISECTGCAVLLLHHNSKPTEYNDGADFRGASSAIGALDSWLNLSAHKRTPGIVRCEFKKFRGIKPDNFEYKMSVTDPDRASLTFLGNSGGFFGQDELKDDLMKEFVVWRTVTMVEDRLWSAYSDRFADRAKFKNAIRNRLKDLYPHELDRRDAGKGGPGRPAFEYRVKEQSCDTDGPQSDN